MLKTILRYCLLVLLSVGVAYAQSKSDELRAKLEKDPDNPTMRYQLGKALVEEGKAPDALKEFLWCFDHGVEYDSSFQETRESVLVSDIYALSDECHGVLKEMYRRRKNMEKELLTLKSEVDHLQNLCRIICVIDQTFNRGFESDDSVALYDKLKKLEVTPEISCVMLDFILEKLIATNRYDDVLVLLNADKGRIDREIEHARKTQPKETPDEPSSVKYSRPSPFLRCAYYYRAFLATNDEENAQALAEKIVGLDSTVNTHYAFISAAIAVKKTDVAKRLLEAGLNTLETGEEKDWLKNLTVSYFE